ncbi:MAG: hypothetical protein LBV32_04715 [Tannerellaceae bacterium]|jgi:hypothetical protein|nr:hypothetical protein [Tannerellaceae bacterium]
MAHKEKIDYLLLDIQELGQKVANMREAEIYPVSFFSQSFELAHKILTDLHKLEAAQLKDLSLQMEEHRSLLSAMPAQKAEKEEEAEKEEPAVDENTTPKAVEVPEAVMPPVSVSVSVQKPNGGKASVSLNEILEKKNLSDFRKAFSLNDRFRFRRELFGGNEERMNTTISALNELHSYEESVAFLHNELQWNVEDEAVADFLKFIEKRFM